MTVEAYRRLITRAIMLAHSVDPEWHRRWSRVACYLANRAGRAGVRI